MFALDTQTGELIVFLSVDVAIANCEKHDVEDGGWLFFDDDGVQLVPEFAPEQRLLGLRVDVPEYTLIRTGDPTSPTLLQRIGEVRFLEGSMFADLDSLRGFLIKHPN